MSAWHATRDALLGVLGEVTPTLRNLHSRPRYDRGDPTRFAELYRAQDTGRLEAWWISRTGGTTERKVNAVIRTHRVRIEGVMAFADEYEVPVDGFTCSADHFDAKVDGIVSVLTSHVQGGARSPVVVSKLPSWEESHASEWAGVGIHHAVFVLEASLISNSVGVP